MHTNFFLLTKYGVVIRVLGIAICIGVFSCSFAQGARDYYWQLGFGTGPLTHPYPQSIEMRFGIDGIRIDTFFRVAGFDFFNASIANEHGIPLLYSNGCDIRDAEHQMIPGTLHLNAGIIDAEWCNGNHGYPVSDAGMFLPFFGDSIIVLLHQRMSIVGSPMRLIIDSLFYTSLIKENGEYRLLEKSIPILGVDLTDGNVEAVKADRLGAWWIIQSNDNSNQYFSILIDSAKVDTIFSYTIGDVLVDGSAGGQASFSPDGNKYARYAPRDDLSLFDFDRVTGLLSNYIKIHVADSGFVGGLAFSPNSRFLYISSQLDLYQFDTWASDIEASRVHLGHYDGFANPFPNVFYHMQLGPDCRIYMNANNGTREWHVIHEPDRKGVDCRFEQHGFHFPVYNTITMPNFPNYRLDIAPVCDPGLVTNLTELQFAKDRINLYPVPTVGPLWIRLPIDWDLNGDFIIEVINNLGQTCFQKKINGSSDTISIGLESLPSGVYTIIISSGRALAAEKFVKVD